MTAQWCSKLGHQYDMAMIERNDEQTKRELDRLRLLPANRTCADCGKGSTVWASVNLGVFLCLRCGSHHRGIGTHISKPKGCTGTYLWGPDEIERMRTIGNERAKQIYGADTDSERPAPDASDAVWRQFLVDKYEKKKFAPKHNAVPLQKFVSNESFPSFGTGDAGSVSSSSTEPDLIHFECGGVVEGTTPAQVRSEQRDQARDFFAQFGL
jgi:Putative GTPase activating protein for Arf